jgi:4-amino-4-deoxy-L-arabinose transferase-like glycosyltransferase
MDDRAATAWSRDPRLALLLALAALFYGCRLASLPLRGEESRWTRVAAEMAASGDWAVPRQQGEPFLSRPPLGSWLIAGSGKLLGDLTPLAVRLPTFLAILATTTLLFAYARHQFGRDAALGAGLAFLTSGQMLQIGRVAETDTLFAALIFASLVAWHAACSSGRLTLAWTSGYALAALGALAKGPQAPIYFVATTWTYLLLRRDWRALLAPGHVAGLGLFVGITGSWIASFAARAGWSAVPAIFVSDVGMRFWNFHWTVLAKHLATFPLEAAAALLPWSALGLAYLEPRFRRTLAGQGTTLLFWACAFAFMFTSCWIVPNAKSRYLVPAFPIVALFAGVVLGRALDTDPATHPALWPRFLRAMALLAVAAPIVFLAATLGPWPALKKIAPPPWMLALLAAVAAAAVVLTRRARLVPSPTHGAAAAVAVAALVGTTFAGPILEAEQRESVPLAAAVARLKSELPPDARLVSLGPIHHLFAYYYREPIPLRPEPGRQARLQPGERYFCFGGCDAPYRPVQLPFAWEPVAVLSCERTSNAEPKVLVVVGRLLDEPPVPAARVALDRVDAILRGDAPGRLR